MSWDPTWEAVHSARAWGRYPPEELVRFVARRYGAADRAQLRALDLGSGSGASSWFLAREGFSVVGVDGSDSALRRATGRLREETETAAFVRADLLALPLRDRSVDLTIDICSIQHNSRENALAIMREVTRVLRPDGRHFGIVVARGTSGDGRGTALGDDTFTEIPDGPYAGRGMVRFHDESAVRELLAGLADPVIDRSSRTDHGGRDHVLHWVVSAVKPR